MRKRYGLRLGGVLLAIIVLVIVASCGAQSDNAGPGKGKVEPKEVTVGISTDPLTLDPRVVWNLPGMSVAAHVYDKLFFRDENMNMTNVLAESYEWTDPRTLKLQLRKGVKFTNGEPFDGESVKYTIESTLAADSKSPHKPMLDQIDSIAVPDPYTVLIHTKSVYRALVRQLSVPYMMPPKASQEKGDKIATEMVGSGPYKLDSYVPGQQVVVVRNPDYWGDKPYFDKITFRIIPDDGARVAALEAGDVLMINNVPADHIDRLKSSKDLKIDWKPTTRIIYVALMNRPPLDNPKVRQALNYAIDREAIVKNLLKGTGTVAYSPIEKSIFSSTNLGVWPYDPAKAKQLLAEAGYPDGLKISMGTANGRYLQDKQVGEAIAGYLEKVGVKVDLSAPEWANYVKDAYAGKWDAYLLGWGTFNLDPDYAMSTHFNSAYSVFKYKNPKVDELFQKARETLDDVKAAPIYTELQKTVWEDAPWLWLYYQPEIDSWNTKLQGYGPRTDEYLMLTAAHF